MAVPSVRKTVTFFAILAALLTARAALADDQFPPLVNWTAPQTFSSHSASRGASTLADISSPLPFVAVTPCRQYDSRNFTPLPQNTSRAVTLTGAPCGLPTGAVAVSVNITIFNISGATGNGVFQVGTATAPTFAWINFPPTEAQRSNAGALPLGGSRLWVRVEMGAGQLDFIVDVNGYYASTPATPTNYFSVINSGLYAIYGETSNPDLFAAGVYGRVTAGQGQGVFGESRSPTNGTAGVFGLATATTGITSGVFGETDSATNNARGVFGVATATTGQTSGVRGTTNSVTNGSTGVSGVANATTGHTFGVGGRNNSTTDDASAVHGEALGTSGQTYGVDGETYSSTDFTAGVVGNAVSTTGEVFGVLGVSHSLASGVGVVGALVDTAGNPTVYGVLGSATGTAGDMTGPPWGVFAFGDLGAMGAKHFVEPHPGDPTKVILYSSLEGREVGTYFRGTSRIVNHQAVIEVPEDFRIVTDDEGLTVQLTPVGDLATLAVVSQDLNQVVVKASKDVTFHYLVQGVRRAFKDLEPVRIGYEFVPRSPNDTMQPFLTPEARRRLIANGTYNADGTVNMNTAERLGWAKAWRENGVKTRAAPLARPLTVPETADKK